jgi:hypothetical protein
MRRAAFLVGVFLLSALPIAAAGPNGSADAEMQVSVQVVRSCTVSTDGQPTVSCGRAVAPSGAQAPSAQVSDARPATSQSPRLVTVDF